MDTVSLNNDYGLGFYCTDSLEMAKEWGVGKDQQDGYANCYEIECDGLRILELNAPEYCILHWLTVLLQNREFDVPSGLALEAKEYLLANFPSITRATTRSLAIAPMTAIFRLHRIS